MFVVLAACTLDESGWSGMCVTKLFQILVTDLFCATLQRWVPNTVQIERIAYTVF